MYLKSSSWMRYTVYSWCRRRGLLCSNRPMRDFRQKEKKKLPQNKPSRDESSLPRCNISSTAGSAAHGCFVTRWLYNGGVTSELTHRENGRRFLTPLICAGCLLTGLEAASSGKSEGVRLRSARERAASHPVSRQPAQTSGVKKRLPFLIGVVTPL